MIWFTVYFVIVFAEGAGIFKALTAGGLNVHGSIFIIFMMIEIVVMVFCGVELELVIAGLSRIKIGGKWYSILPWLMQPCCMQVRESEYVFVEILAVLVTAA